MLKTTMPRITGRHVWPVFLKAWLLCGTLDLFSAIVINCWLFRKVSVLQVFDHYRSSTVTKHLVIDRLDEDFPDR